ncbi:MAG: histidine triad nucleotide-binding protein [Kistimonas sp.]|nr:histidine triad nucleotide-binding protein [Kistimonas sp.]
MSPLSSAQSSSHAPETGSPDSTPGKQAAALPGSQSSLPRASGSRPSTVRLRPMSMDTDHSAATPKARKLMKKAAHQEDDCIFCQIIQGRSPANIVYRDNLCVAFHDIYPVAPLHLLVVPRKHIANLSGLGAQDKQLMGHMMTTIPCIARQQGVTDYKTTTNTGPGAGQAVFHLHFHLTSRQCPSARQGAGSRK